MIDERLKIVNSLEAKYLILDKSEVTQDIGFLRDIFKSPSDSKNEKDFSNSTREEIIKWFYDLGINEEIVKIYWLSLNEGISIEFETFIKNHDEIWYPSSDDIWVSGNNKLWLIQIDHEEIFSFFSFS